MQCLNKIIILLLLYSIFPYGLAMKKVCVAGYIHLHLHSTS